MGHGLKASPVNRPKWQIPARGASLPDTTSYYGAHAVASKVADCRALIYQPQTHDEIMTPYSSSTFTHCNRVRCFRESLSRTIIILEEKKLIKN